MKSETHIYGEDQPQAWYRTANTVSFDGNLADARPSWDETLNPPPLRPPLPYDGCYARPVTPRKRGR